MERSKRTTTHIGHLQTKKSKKKKKQKEEEEEEEKKRYNLKNISCQAIHQIVLSLL